MHAHRFRAKMYAQKKKTQAFRGKIKLNGEKVKEKLKKLKEKLKNSLSGKALLWYMPKIRRKKTPVIVNDPGISNVIQDKPHCR